MKKLVFAGLMAFGLGAAIPASAQTVGNAATDRATVDTCSVCTFVVNQVFPVAGRTVNSYTLFAESAGSIVPLLLSRADVGTTANFTVLAIGQQRNAAAGLNTFDFNAVQGANLTGANSYFGFAYPGSGVVSFDYTLGGVNTGTFVGPQSYIPVAVGETFSSDFSSQPDNSYGALNARTYSINATAVPEPASWALMIGGVGLVGGTLRRRKARPVLAAA